MKKKIGDKVLFTGAEYNITKIFNYEERLKDKDLIIEEIVDCPCNDERMDCLKFRGIDDFWFRAGFFEVIGNVNKCTQ